MHFLIAAILLGLIWLMIVNRPFRLLVLGLLTIGVILAGVAIYGMMQSAHREEEKRNAEIERESKLAAVYEAKAAKLILCHAV